MKRKSAYRWMQETLGLSKAEAHIGNFSVQQCELLIEAVRNYRIMVLLPQLVPTKQLEMECAREELRRRLDEFDKKFGHRQFVPGVK